MDFQPNRDEELRRRILQTFADVPYPGDNNLVPVQERHAAEYQNTEHFFRGRHWQELAQARRALQTGGGLSFLTPEAWCFFLPAYLLIALSEESGLADIAWTTLFQLTPPRSADLDDFFQRQISCLSPAQQECVAAFVRLFHEREPEDTIIQAAAAFLGRARERPRGQTERLQTQPKRAHRRKRGKRRHQAAESALLYRVTPPFSDAPA